MFVRFVLKCYILNVVDIIDISAKSRAVSDQKYHVSPTHQRTALHQELKKKRALADEERKKMIRGKRANANTNANAAVAAGGGADSNNSVGIAGRPRAKTAGAADERSAGLNMIPTPSSALGGGLRGRRHSAHTEGAVDGGGRGNLDETAALMLSKVASMRRSVEGEGGGGGDGEGAGEGGGGGGKGGER